MTAWIQAPMFRLQRSAWPGALLEVLIESVIVLAVAALWCRLHRRGPAATRHLIWFLAVASLPLLLFASSMPHAWLKPIWSVSTGFNSGNQISLSLALSPLATADNPTPPVETGKTTGAAYISGRTAPASPPAARFNVSWLALAFLLWAAGAALGLVLVAVGHLRLGKLTRSSTPVTSADWDLIVRDARQILHLHRRPQLWQSGEDLMPLTWGWWPPKVLLPATAAEWTAARRRVVLLHEFAHAKRWDCLTQFLAQTICALFWVNPLVWLAVRNMRAERERACDDLVLNGGCKASDYAAQLLEIANAFRHTQYTAAIAMARPAHLRGRIAAIVDASLARRLHPAAAAGVIVFMGVLVGCIAGTNGKSEPDSPETAALRQQQLDQMKLFAAAKEKQSKALAVEFKDEYKDAFQSAYRKFFDAAAKGDWRYLTNRYSYFKHHHSQYSIPKEDVVEWLHTPSWQPVLEVCLAFDQVVNCEPKYTKILADGIINSIPPGSIYFGGTDPGRGVPTAFEKSSIDGVPFFCLSQNPLADCTYLEYLRSTYGAKIHMLDADDQQKCFQDYLDDAKRRLEANLLDPGEDVKVVDKQVEVSGPVAVMSLNGLAVRLIFDRNPDREFYIEESFPLKWMYPYLEPHALIMKINRQPLAQLSDDVLARDHDYWSKLVAGMIGDWINDKTTTPELAAFAERVYGDKNLNGFTGDPLYVRNDYAKRTFSKLRSSIGGIYAWRLNPDCPAEYRPKSDAERQRLLKEADFAFAQAVALCPYSPEAVFRYCNLLIQFGRVNDALLVARACLKLEPTDGQVEVLVNNLERFKKDQEGADQAKGNMEKLEAEVRDHPTNFQAAFDLALAYLQSHNTDKANQVLDGILNDPHSVPAAILGVAQAYGQLQNWPKLEVTLEKLVKVMPDNPEAWYDLAAFKANTGKTNEAIPALRQALDLNAKRLQNDPKAKDLLAEARKDQRFNPLRQSPDFQKLVPP